MKLAPKFELKSELKLAKKSKREKESAGNLLAGAVSFANTRGRLLAARRRLSAADCAPQTVYGTRSPAHSLPHTVCGAHAAPNANWPRANCHSPSRSARGPHLSPKQAALFPARRPPTR